MGERGYQSRNAYAGYADHADRDVDAFRGAT